MCNEDIGLDNKVLYANKNKTKPKQTTGDGDEVSCRRRESHSKLKLQIEKVTQTVMEIRSMVQIFLITVTGYPRKCFHSTSYYLRTFNWSSHLKCIIATNTSTRNIKCKYSPLHQTMASILCHYNLPLEQLSYEFKRLHQHKLLSRLLQILYVVLFIPTNTLKDKGPKV